MAGDISGSDEEILGTRFPFRTGDWEERYAGEKVNILLVDDRADKLLALDAMVSHLNQNVVHAHSGKEALRCLLQQDFAVILLDVNMPIMDGFETAALIRQRPRSEHTPIIFISAVNDTDNHVSRGYSLGAVDYILTPVVPEILRAKVAVFVDLFRKTEQVKRQAEERTQFVREQAARAEAEAAQRRSDFLARASNVLAGSLEYQQTFDNLARIIVPKLADFCILDMVEEDGSFRAAAVAHRDPSCEDTLRELRRKFPVAYDTPHAVSRAFREVRSELCTQVDEEMLRGLATSDEHLAMLLDLKITSFVVTPLSARGRILGAMSLVRTEGHPAYGGSDLSLAEELAQRAALALDNARLYKAAHNARTEAERANLAKDQFLAMLSHELRTPLTPVLISVLALESQTDLSDNLRDSLRMIRRNVELEARLIDDLLDLTRVSKGKVQLNLETVDAHSLLEHAVEICRGEIEEKGLIVSRDLRARKFHLDADPARMQQIFWNLIKNAVKFTPAGGTLFLRTSSDDQPELLVEISDTGLGIEPNYLPKIFDAFEQGDRPRFGGLGLGLAITKALVNIHGGRIHAESEGHNRGATFKLWFPTVQPFRDAAPGSGTGAGAARRNDIRLLLVEDHEDTNRSLTMLLRRRGYHVESATDIESAMNLATTFEFDVLISDMGLPDGTGLDLMRQLNSNQGVCGIALSGFGMEEDLRKSRAAGFAEHLTKPVDLNRLDAVIQQVVGPRSALVESAKNGELTKAP